MGLTVVGAVIADALGDTPTPLPATTVVTGAVNRPVRSLATASATRRPNHDAVEGSIATAEGSIATAEGSIATAARSVDPRRDFTWSAASAVDGPRGVSRGDGRCDGRVDSVDDELRDDTAEESDPDEPRDPAESASAKGIAAAAEPTPRAMASEPTRPT